METESNMSNKNWSEYIDTIKREVVPALGCTEPIAIALASAKATEALGTAPKKIKVLVSGNLLKNGMGVGVPGTGMTGLDIAAAVGATGGKPELDLEVLRDLTPEQVEKAKQMLADGLVSIELATETKEVLYVEAIVEADGMNARCAIARTHTGIVLVEKNGETIFSVPLKEEKKNDSGSTMSIASIYEFATCAPIESLNFILEAVKLNEAIAIKGLASDWGLMVGRSIEKDIIDGIRSDDIISYAVKITAAASDARMEGIQMPVMSNSGSGNQGLTATLPVLAFSKRLKSTEEQLIRALIMSHLTAIHMKKHLGRLSALCGASMAATAAGCGIVMLLGGGLDKIEKTIKNTLGDIAGLICDGAKTSCALKVASAVEAAINGALLAMRDVCIPGKDGILDEDIESFICNIGTLGSVGMVETDKVILKIMTDKASHAKSA